MGDYSTVLVRSDGRFVRVLYPYIKEVIPPAEIPPDHRAVTVLDTKLTLLEQHGGIVLSSSNVILDTVTVSS